MVRKLQFILLFFSFSLLFSVPKLTGDLEKNLALTETGNLHTILQNIAPLCDAALLVGNDGTAVLIPAYAFAEVTLTVQDGNWNSSAPLLPPVAKIRNIKEICLQQIPAKYAVTIKDSQQTSVISPFQFILSQFIFLGDSSKNGYLLRKFKSNINMNSAVTSEIGNFTDTLEFTSGKTCKLYKNSKAVQLSGFYFHLDGDTLKTIIRFEGNK